MVKINIEADCGNSPKKEFLKDFNIAFAEGNLSFISENITDDVIWVMVGDKRIEGKDAFMNELEQMKDSKVTELTVDKIITHGKEGSANGEIVMSDGNTYAFSDVYEFKSAKGNSLKSITSFVIKV